MLLRFVFLLLPFALVLSVVQAQPPGRDMEKERKIWDQLQTIAPKALEDFKAATVAMDAENYEEAARLYESVRQRAPEFDHVLRRLGTTLALKGEVQSGLELLEQAAIKNSSPENLISLAQFLAYPGQGMEGTQEQKRRAFSLAKQANQLLKSGDDADYQLLLAQLALELDQLEEFRRATERLVATHPELMVSHYFNAILAANDEKWAKAEAEIRQAESLGLPHEVAQKFLDSGVHTRAVVWRYAIYALGMVTAWIGGLTLLFLVGKVMSKKTLNSIESSNPNLAAGSSEVSLRKWYRRLINLAGLYYYISIPVVIFLVIVTAASITYGFLLLGRLPVKLVVILCIGAVVTVYKMIRSLFLKIESEDPGRSLTFDEAPKLWNLTRVVAEAVGTRPVDDIRITPGTDLAVYEKGTFRERSHDQAQRILIIGAGVLNNFEQNGFRAVLAHEYGHFSHRDTAGGDIAIRVNADMTKFAHAMILSGQAVWWNVAFHFLRVYHFIFRRISHGATRLQEVLADRVAATEYGPGAFEEGLKHVVRKSVEFNFIADREINESANSRRGLQNLYELQTMDNPDLEGQIAEALNRQTSEDDTHPCPNDRFRFTRRIAASTEPPIAGFVWDLFTDREAVTNEMTLLVQSNLQQAQTN